MKERSTRHGKRKKSILVLTVFAIILGGGLVFFAYARSWGKMDIEVSFRINEELASQSAYGKSPTMAIWIEDVETHATQTIFVTHTNDVQDRQDEKEDPVILPKWDEITKEEKQIHNDPELKSPLVDVVTGATPKTGYFSASVRVKTGSTWLCWIEINLLGDYNEHYQEYNSNAEYGNGQPALVYKTKIEAVEGYLAVPEIVGMSVINNNGGKILQPVKGITTAQQLLEEIKIKVVKPKPRIIE